MVKAQQQQTGMAVSSLSGDLIKLITDRCLVPNITPAGVSSGLAAQITTLATEIIGHYENILGNIDNIQTLVLGERMDAANVRVVIESLSDVIDQDKAIIDKCEERMRAIKDEIDTLGPKLAEEQDRKAEQTLNAEYAEVAAVEENSPITDEPNADVASWNAQLFAEYNNLKRSDYKTDAEYQSARGKAQRHCQIQPTRLQPGNRRPSLVLLYVFWLDRCAHVHRRERRWQLPKKDAEGACVQPRIRSPTEYHRARLPNVGKPESVSGGQRP